MVITKQEAQKATVAHLRTMKENIKKIVAAFRGMHVSLRNIALESVTEKCDRRTDRQTDDGQSDPYVLLCFAGNTKI